MDDEMHWWQLKRREDEPAAKVELELVGDELVIVPTVPRTSVKQDQRNTGLYARLQENSVHSDFLKTTKFAFSLTPKRYKFFCSTTIREVERERYDYIRAGDEEDKGGGHVNVRVEFGEDAVGIFTGNRSADHPIFNRKYVL